MSGVKDTGVKLVFLCEPSQKGWVFDCPHWHQCLVSPALSSTFADLVPAIFGLVILFILHFEIVVKAWLDWKCSSKAYL